MGKYNLADLLDIPRLQSALDSLYASSRIPSAIIDIDGKIHTGSGWQDICTKFHRVNPETRRRCIESDLYISGHIHEANPSVTYRCPHGLVDSATPIIIDGEHLGNVFTGQLFLGAPDLDFFRAQARTYGFDEGDYIDAVKKVPVIPERTMRENLAFIAHLTAMLVEMGLERKRDAEATRRLRESEERYHELFENANDIIYTHDMAGNFTSFNKATESVAGYTPEEASKLNIVSVLAPGYAEIARQMISRKAVEGGQTRYELEIISKDGRRVPLEVSTRIINRDGAPVGVQGIARDITERKRAEEEKRKLEQQVLQAQKLESLGVLAGGIAHDFNNILMVVLGHAELALSEVPPLSATRRSLAEIAIAARRAADLCRQMLAYAGKASFALERVELSGLVEEMSHFLKSAVSKKATLNLKLERGLPPIQADPSQIRQIVMNLIINASEAIGDRSGVIDVSVGASWYGKEYLRGIEPYDDLAPGVYVHVEVADTGSGMDARTRSRIFEPFFTTKFAGRGLGLAAVLGIVRAHKGALKVYTEPGRGTTFKVLFPAAEEEGSVTSTGESSPLSGWRGTGTILLVDDEESLRALGSRMLEQLGFDVLTAADGQKAVELYRERGREIDLVLMDLTMPHMDGVEAFGELLRLNPEVRVILASGYSREDVTARFAEKGFGGILQKPYTLARLTELLAGLMPARPDGVG